MTVARRARTYNSLGTLSTRGPSVALSSTEVEPTIRIREATISYGVGETTIWKNNRWQGKKFPARRETVCLFKLTVVGKGRSLVSAVFTSGSGVDYYLFIRRLRPGQHFIRVEIPFNELPNFRFAIGNKADYRIDTSLLSNREKAGLTRNMLLESETNNAYYTTGLGGLGELSFNEVMKLGRQSRQAQRVDKDTPGFVRAAHINSLPTNSGTYTLWSGDLGAHNWKLHGWSGLDERSRHEIGKDEFGKPSKEKRESRRDRVEGPYFVADKSGYYAFRGSTYQMSYDAQGNLKGYDAMEKLERGMPAGVPICMVLQYYYHDPVSPGISSFAGGPNHDSLGVVSWVKEKAKKAKKKLTNINNEIEAFETNVAKSVVRLVEDPSLSNLSDTVASFAGGSSLWNYANGVTIDKENLFLLDTDVLKAPGSITYPSNIEGLFTSNGDTSAIPYKIQKDGEFERTFTHNGIKYQKKDFAYNLEWYDESKDTWSKPQKSPPFSLKTNSKGKIKLIFRVPRQLDPEGDRAEIRRGIDAGFPDYGYNNSSIKQAFPTFNFTKGKKEYILLGRTEPKSFTGDQRVSFSQVIDGVTYRGRQSITGGLFMDPPSHPLAQHRKSSKKSIRTDIAFGIHVADPAKFTYLDNPEVDFSYYVDGELKPESTVIVIGKALGTLSSENAILTQRGWANGTPKEDLGTKEPAGDTPAYVAKNVIKPNAMSPRTEQGKEGTNRADFLELVNSITTNDLEDEISYRGEEVLKTTWKSVFGKELNVNWFNEKKLDGHDPNNPKNYLIQGSRGETYSFPFSIAWFQIPKYYTGPYLDYNEEGQLQQIEGRPYAISSPQDNLYIVVRSLFGKLMQQKFDIVAETTDQKIILEQGFEPDDTFSINTMDYDAEDVTEIADVDARIRNYLNKTNQVHPSDDKGDTRYVRYTNSFYKSKFKINNPDVVRVPEAQPPILAGFSNQSNFYVEDVTEKWGALNGAMAGSEDSPLTLDILPVGVEATNEEDTPFIGFAGLGSSTPNWDAIETGTVRTARILGKATVAFGTPQVKAIADFNAKEAIAATALFGASAALLGILAYSGTKGALSGAGSFFGNLSKGRGEGKAAKTLAKARSKAEIIRAKGEVKSIYGSSANA